MTFPTKLERLLKEATEGPWIPDNNEGFSPWRVWEKCSPSGNGIAGKCVADIRGDSAETDANAELIAYLRNHADAILGLVRAAESAHQTLADEGFHAKALRLGQALAKLNGGKG